MNEVIASSFRLEGVAMLTKHWTDVLVDGEKLN
jgi:hypothetical protein